jgi:thymidine phosphorylase
MVTALGGPADLIENMDKHLDKAPIIVPVPALQSGYATSTDCRGIGLAVVSLGGGRRRPTDAIDFAVGLTDLVELGQKIEKGQPLAMVHARTEAAAQQAIAEIQAAYHLGDAAPAANPIVYRTIRP